MPKKLLFFLFSLLFLLFQFFITKNLSLEHIISNFSVHAQHDPTPPPPGSFSQFVPVPVCDSPNNSRITVSWTGSSDAANYTIRYTTPGGTFGGNWTTSGTTYNITSGLTPGSQYSFVVYASNDSPPPAISDNGTWSHQKFGTYTTYPDCAPPGNFSFSANPQGVCQGINPQINLNWGSSSGATNYQVRYRNPDTFYANTGVIQNATVTGLTPNNQYGFRIIASKNTNPYNPYVTYSNGGNWTDTVYGPTTFPDCSQPIINLFLNDTPYLEVKQNEPVTISWDTTNAVACTASIPSTTPPPSQALINAWSGVKSTSGLQNLPSIPTIGTYTFTLTCTNASGVSASATNTLNVTQLQKPYIQTTGGDVHTNESITIPR